MYISSFMYMHLCMLVLYYSVTLVLKPSILQYLSSVDNYNVLKFHTE